MRKQIPITTILQTAILATQVSASQMVMETAGSRLVIQRQGGGITEFMPAGSGINPLTWDSATGEEAEQDTARQRGHFICLDRWGPASEAEAANGMPPHGEASRVEWEVTRQPVQEKGHLLASMRANLPMAGLAVGRSVRLDNESSVFRVTESVRNAGKIGRIYNLVQHPSIAAPFLNGQTIVTCNATSGFPQSGTLADPEVMASDWPTGLRPDGSRTDIRRLTDDAVPSVISYVFEDEIGWIAAVDPFSLTILGYLWKQEDYPWINLWRRIEDNKPYARGLEFGTTGLHRTYDELVRKGSIMDRPLFRHIDAGEVQKFDYICFMVKAPPGYGEIREVRIEGASIRLKDINGKDLRIPVDISLLRL